MRYAGRPENRVRMWVKHVMTTGGIERFDELHLDQIDPAWADKSQWKRGMTASLEVARSICTELAPGKLLALICSLEDGPGAAPANLEELASQFDWTPPAFHLFHLGKEPWNQSSTDAKRIHLPLDHFPELKASKVFLSEWNQEDCLRRSFYAL